MSGDQPPMTPERWKQVEQLFHAVLEQTDEQRAAFLNEACKGDDELRRELESLMAHQSHAESLLETPVMEVAAKAFADNSTTGIIGSTFGHYQILSLLGKGGMGEVYRARDVRLDRTVALKILPADMATDAERMRRFVSEAKAASALNHPYVATIYEIGEAEDVRFIAMEYVEGQTLTECINGQPLATNEIVEIGSQIADALDEAHGKGITHRDIKPANVMLTARGQVKVLDFGLAKIARPRLLESDVSTLAKTHSGVVMGTVPYMSPEQALGREVDHRSDLFSLGIVLYEMATGQLPFAGANTSETLDRILHSQPEAMARFNYDVPVELERIVRKCLEKERERRYQSARELLVDLKNLKRESESSARTTPKAESLLGRIKRHKIGVAFALLALVGVITGVSYLPSLLRQKSSTVSPQLRPLTQLTYGTGLQDGPSWSPDGRFIAYGSNRSGNFDIWVQQVNSGDPVQVTKSTAHDVQPDWSHDGTNIVFRSERDEGGLFIVPALGGNERKISSFGFSPCWSPDDSRILFNNSIFGFYQKAYVVALDGQVPREVHPEFFSGFFEVRGIAWHPDGQRISVWGNRGSPKAEFWTLSLSDNTRIKSELSAEVEKQLNEANVWLGQFQWASSGQYLYFTGGTNYSGDIWRVTVDPQTLRWITGLERLTTNVNPGKLALSKDGKKLAYATSRGSRRIWSLPFDAANGRIKGAGQPVFEAGINASITDLSRDGKKLAYRVARAGKLERWVKSLDDGHSKLLAVEDSFVHDSGYWSRDGSHLIARRYSRNRQESGDTWLEVVDFSLVIYPEDGGSDQVLTSPTSYYENCWDWSTDGQWVLGSVCPPTQGRSIIRLLPILAAPRAETQAREVTSSDKHSIWQTYFSPNEQWITFNAVKYDTGISTIYVVPTSGGEWIGITEGKYGADKPRWAPDGKTIYFVSNRSGFFNLWGIRFDQVIGKPVGEPFRVTSYESPDQMIEAVGDDEIGISSKRFVVAISEVSGNIWTLGNVDR